MTERTPSPCFSEEVARSIVTSCLFYGIFGIVVALPLLGVAMFSFIAPLFASWGSFRLPFTLFNLAYGAFAVWTFLLPLLAGLGLLATARNVRANPQLAIARFRQAYRVAKIGCIFSYIPFLAIAGSIGILMFMGSLIEGGSGWNRGLWYSGVTFALSVLAVGYYVVFFRLRKLRNEYFAHEQPGN